MPVSTETTGSRNDRTPRKPRLDARDLRPRTSALDRQGWLLLASSGWYIRLADVLDQPMASALAGEDACWLFALTDWQQRRPRRRRSAGRREWQAEGVRLQTKRDRLVEMTRQVRTLRPKRATASRADQANGR